MKHFLLFYDLVDDYLERREAHRPAHFAHVKASLERNELVLAGPCVDPDGSIGVLMFKTSDKKTVEDFARTDPYVLNGVAKGWRVREWTTVAGRDALTQVTF